MVHISGFCLGVLATLSAEMVFIIIVCVKMALSDKRKGRDSNAEKSDHACTSTYNRDGEWNDGAGR